MLAVITVDSLLDNFVPSYPTTDGLITLREAIVAANTDSAVGDAPAGSGVDTIVFSPSLDGGQIDLSLSIGELAIADALTIDAIALSNGLTIDAGDGADGTFGTYDGFRIFNINDGTGSEIDVELKGLTLTGGDVNGSGGAVYSYENLTVTSCTITQNAASGVGGGVCAYGTITLQDSDITFNTSGTDGGGVRCHSASIVCHNNRINDNTTGGIGGGMAMWDSVADIQMNEVSGNTANQGGGLYARNCTIELINGNTVNDNDSAIDVGGVYLVNVDGNVIGNTISGNVSNVVGGLHINGNNRFDGQVSNNTVENNQSVGGRGGGIDLRNGVFEVCGNTVTGNSAYYDGGGFYLNACYGRPREQRYQRQQRA